MSQMVNTARLYVSGVVLGALGLVVGAAAMQGCFERPPYTETGHEIGDLLCHDGLDNDGDGLIDCEDPDCIYASTWCGEFIPPNIEIEREPEVRLINKYCRPLIPNGVDANGEEVLKPNPSYNMQRCRKAGFEILQVCHDGIDNDADGQFDCGTTNCSRIMENCCSKEFTKETCSDGKDNDKNGFADCADYSCRRGLFVADVVCLENTEALCSDGKDNNGNGFIDCKDKSCAKTLYCRGLKPETEEQCRKGNDNPLLCVGKTGNELKQCQMEIDPDGDGKVGCKDSHCAELALCQKGEVDLGPENTYARCTDGVDNDGNNYVDCNDFGCTRNAVPGDQAAITEYCANLPDYKENTVEKCSDGIDNDGNGYIDCNDNSCKKSEVQEILDYCASVGENSWEQCTDEIDNDSNGYVDCADFSCSRNTGPDRDRIIAYCQENAEVTLEKCSDGKDNDGNGYTDCEDYSCSRNENEEILKYCESVGEMTYGKCTDGIDNDNNGYTDCEDYSCRRNGKEEIARLCQESAGSAWNANVACSDGQDNDGDGFIDCEDWDCSHNPVVVVCISHTDVCSGGRWENTELSCSDKIDNDGDGAIDCCDKGCIRKKACEDGSPSAIAAFKLCPDWFDQGGKWIHKERACGDDIDNDGDGDVDCCDYGCLGADECKPGSDGAKKGHARCENKIDADGNWLLLVQ